MESIHRLIHLRKAARRAERIRNEASLYYNGMLHNLCKISSYDKSLSFVVRRVGIFRGPKVERIERPVCVALCETDDCVIVKDGNVYQLTREAR